MAMTDFDAPNERYVAHVSQNGGGTFSNAQVIAAGDALLPSLAVEEATGNVVVAWLDGRGTASINNGVYVTTFSPAGGYLTAARIEFPPAVRRRGANH